LTKKTSKIITIGTFDGVHLGHQKILKHVIDSSKTSGFCPAVLTLFPHPRMVLQQQDDIKLLNTIDERIEILKKNQIEEVIVKKFDTRFANLSAEAYVKNVLVEELNAKHVVIGYDHHFGKNRTANVQDLISYSKKYNFKVEEISAKDVENVTISSTKIRKALNHGHVAIANTYLGYDYFITGDVVKGKGIGRTLDFPTANIYINESYKLIPADGVYVVKSTINNNCVYGMMNIGTNPTVEGKTRSIEVNFFDFSEDIYHETLRIAFLKRLRSEQKFENLEALKSQLKKDMNAAMTYIQSINENE
jgi:riboflavin kinase/FMN adenylyltransferase